MKLTWNELAKVALIVGAAVSLTMGCSCDGNSDDSNNHDKTGVPWTDPEKVEVFTNVDGHPNVAVLCIHKVAWVTTTRAGESLRRVPEYDVPVCGGVESKWEPVRPDVHITMQQAG